MFPLHQKCSCKAPSNSRFLCSSNLLTLVHMHNPPPLSLSVPTSPIKLYQLQCPISSFLPKHSSPPTYNVHHVICRRRLCIFWILFCQAHHWRILRWTILCLTQTHTFIWSMRGAAKDVALCLNFSNFNTLTLICSCSAATWAEYIAASGPSRAS